MKKAASTMIIYAIYCDGFCHENMIYSYRAAEKLARRILQTNPMRNIQIARYDRSECSNYFEIVKHFN